MLQDLKCELVQLIRGLDMAKFLRLLMDGQNTNWNVSNLINNLLVENEYKNLIEIGSCSLHTVHGAFQTDVTKTGWELNKVLKAMYTVFNESSAQCDVNIEKRKLK